MPFGNRIDTNGLKMGLILLRSLKSTDKLEALLPWCCDKTSRPRQLTEGVNLAYGSRGLRVHYGRGSMLAQAGARC